MNFDGFGIVVIDFVEVDLAHEWIMCFDFKICVYVDDSDYDLLVWICLISIRFRFSSL